MKILMYIIIDCNNSCNRGYFKNKIKLYKIKQMNNIINNVTIYVCGCKSNNINNNKNNEK